MHNDNLWKIITGKEDCACWMGPQYPNGTDDPACSTVVDCGDGGCLFNLYEDPTEHSNVASAHPQVLQFMQLTLAKMNQGFFDPTRGGGNTSVPIQAAIAYGGHDGGYWGPFLK